MTHHPRYARSEMTNIWTDENRFQKMLDVEIAAAEVMADFNIIPAEAAKDIREKAKFDVARIREIEKETRHDTIAFLTAVTENVGENGRYLHQGMTSSDALDSGFALQLREAADVLLSGLDAVLIALKGQIKMHKATPCIGRSHGIHAEPTTFGLKLAGHYAAFKRGKKRLEIAREDIATCMVSGAVGTHATFNPEMEIKIAEKLGLSVEPISTQVIPRDRHAMFFSVLAVIASSIENLVTEIRHLQRTEVLEVAENFAKGQKGSSAMPHKKNPILSENLTGLARVIRSSIAPALENVTLWHERDMSHSSVERFIAPQTTITLDFALHRLAGIIEGLQVYPGTMKANIDKLNGLVYSQSVLLALTQAGVSREDAYTIVQRNAMKVWDGEGVFLDLLKSDKDVTESLSEQELEHLFDEAHILRHVDALIDRALAV
jgi:adenylosuccinate lyase